MAKKNNDDFSKSFKKAAARFAESTSEIIAERIKEMFWNEEQFKNPNATILVDTFEAKELEEATIERKGRKGYQYPEKPRMAKLDLIDSIRSRKQSTYVYEVGPSDGELEKAVGQHKGQTNAFGRGIKVPARPFMGVPKDMSEVLDKTWRNIPFFDFLEIDDADVLYVRLAKI